MSPRLTADQVGVLRGIAERGNVPQRVARRAMIILLASGRGATRNEGEAKRLSDHGIAAQVGVCADTVRSTIRKFEEAGFEAAVFDKPFVRKVTAEAEQRLLELVQSPPPDGLQRWTLELLAEKLCDLRVVESISDTGVWDILQKRGIRIERSRSSVRGASSREQA